MSSGVEAMALLAKLGSEERCLFFNSVYRHSFLPAIAETTLSVVPYVMNLYSRESPNLRFALNGEEVEISSLRGTFSKASS